MKHIIRLLAPTAYLNSPRQGAVQTGVIKTTSLLSKRVKSTIISGHLEGMPFYENINGVDYLRIKLKAPWYLKLLGQSEKIYYLAAIKIIQKLKPGIVHVHNRPAIIPLLRKRLGKDIKIILHEHNHNLRDMFKKRKAEKIIKACDHIIEISEYSKNYDIAELFPQYLPKVSIVNRGVDIKQFRPLWESPDKRSDIRKKYGIENKKAVLFTGAIRDRKGIQHVVEAFEPVVKAHPDAVLIIAGGSAKNIDADDAFSRKVFERTNSYNDNVIITGFIPYAQVQDLYLAADIYCAPSVWPEPFGLVFVEAMASGLPVISSKRGAIPEIVVDGETGLLVDDPADTDDLTKKLNILLADDKLRKTMGKAGRKRVEKNFTWEHSADKLNFIYNKLTTVVK